VLTRNQRAKGKTMKHPERSSEPRTKWLSDHRAEFKFPGVPVYQFKARDISEVGAGIVVRADSGFLNMIMVQPGEAYF